jgi:ATP-dependent RNA helicase DHX37/DHR1
MPVPKAPVVEIPTSLGSGLKRPLEVDEFGLPILKKVKKKHKHETATEEIDEDEHTVSNDVDMEEGGTWEGFGSEDDDINGEVSSESENEQESEGSDAESSEGEDESEEDEDDEESAEEGEDDEMETGEEEKRPSWRKTAGKSERASSFKAWAEAARNKILETSDKQSTSLGAVPGEVISSFPSAASLSKSLNTTSQDEEPRYSAANKPVVQPMLVKKSLDTLLSESKDGRIARAVAVNRNEDIQTQRLQLPIVGDEQRIMETIHNNLVTILCGETGSGKTTQVPQFLFEAGYGDPQGDTPGMIGVTQPRRVAAVTMAKRVADELGEHSGRVSYQVYISAREFNVERCR